MVATLMAYQVEMEVSSLRDLDWEHLWENILDLRWEILLVQYLELWEFLLVLAHPMDYQVDVLRVNWGVPRWNLKWVLQGTGWTWCQHCPCLSRMWYQCQRW